MKTPNVNAMSETESWICHQLCTEVGRTELLLYRITEPNYFFVPVPVPTGTFENSTGTGTDLLVLLQNRYFFRYF